MIGKPLRLIDGSEWVSVTNTKGKFVVSTDTLTLLGSDGRSKLGEKRQRYEKRIFSDG